MRFGLRIFLMSVFERVIRSFHLLRPYQINYFYNTKTLGATAGNGFQILILHPKYILCLIEKNTFFGGGHLVSIGI